MERILGQSLSDAEDEDPISESAAEELAELMRDDDDDNEEDGPEDEDEDEEEEEDPDSSDPRMRELAEMQREMEGLEQLSAALASATGNRNRGSAGASASGSSSRLLSIFRSSRLFGNSDEPEVDDEEPDEENQRHPNVTCDGCHAGPMLTGRVMHCTDCPDFDLCSRCFSDLPSIGHPAGHRFTPRRPTQSRSLAPSQLLLQMLESAMMSEAMRRSVEVAGEPTPEEMRARSEKRGREILAKLPKEAWSETLKVGLDGFQAECALCLEDYSHGEEVLKLPCCHYFHEDCVRPWFGKSLLCPICNQAASTEAEETETTAP
mmetsp:Transcript_52667/g.115027  ORF Transcript_52667/g.115027 Transcript_52667/m.115027 type:complete len:320 (-) Transcript_52667:97-1056(-)